jgi:hypothetical protein
MIPANPAEKSLSDTPMADPVCRHIGDAETFRRAWRKSIRTL